MVRNLLFFMVLLSFSASGLWAQGELQTVPALYPHSDFKSEYDRRMAQHGAKTTACGKDTLYYARYKSTADNFISIQPGASAPTNGIAMYFEAPVPVKVYGFTFYADCFPAQSVNCRLYYGATDRRPGGAALASKSHTITNSFRSIPFMKNTVMFDSGIVMTADFALAVELTGSVNVNFACNDWTANDGDGDNNSSVRFGTGWTNNLNIGGVAFDADFYIEPILEYDLVANFKPADFSCLGKSPQMTYTNTSAPALNKMYSAGAVDNKLDDMFEWDYDNGTPLDKRKDGFTSYTILKPYDVHLTANFEGWTMTCTDDTVITVDQSNVQAGFTSNKNKLTVTFNDNSVDAKEWIWDFGDGSAVSTLQNPVHIYGASGNFTVKQIVKDDGCIDSVEVVVIVDEFAGIGDHEKDAQLKVVSPFNDVLSMDVGPDYFTDGPATVELFDIMGKLVYQTHLNRSGNQILDPGALDQGPYFLRVTGGQHQVSRRVLKY